MDTDRSEGLEVGEPQERVDLRASSDDGLPGATASSTTLDHPPSTRFRINDWTNFAALPVLELFYLAHVRYRRFSPRRLPTLTSMSVHSIYAYLGATMAPHAVFLELQDEALYYIELMADSADRFLDLGGRDTLRRIRDLTYQCQSAPGVLGKLAWWHNHIWSSEETWLRTAATWEIRFGHAIDFNSVADFDRWFTHVASTVQSEPDEDNKLLFRYADYRVKSLIPFAALIPLAMATHWMGRRSLFRPVHGLQRLLLWGLVYPGYMQACQHYTYLRGFENKHQFAQDLREEFGLDSKNNPTD